jgi:hypothetical protein
MQSSVLRFQHVTIPQLRISRRTSAFTRHLRAVASGDLRQTVKMALPHLEFQGPIKDMGRAPPSLAELQQLLATSMEVGVINSETVKSMQPKKWLGSSSSNAAAVAAHALLTLHRCCQLKQRCPT